MILTLSKNNPIETAKEARFKEDLRTFQDELSLYISKQYTNAGGHWDGNISAKKYDDIVNYIPSFTKKYEGKFVINNNNLEYTNELDEKEKEYAQSLNVKDKSRLLPDEFRQVEYLESTGTQYIDTGIIPNSELNCSIEFMRKIDDRNDGYLFGSTNGANTDYFGVNLFGANHSIECYYGTGGYPKVYVWIKNRKHQIKIENKIFYCDGNQIYDFNNSSNKMNFNTKNSIYLFGLNHNGGRYRANTIYSAKFWYNQKEVRNYISCYSKTTVTDVNGKQCPYGTKGMYDTVEGKFYTNQGTGEFIAGPDVE